MLWMFEQMTAPANADGVVPQLWSAATARGHRAPDWRPGRPPELCELDDAGYRELLRERATEVSVMLDGTVLRATGPVSSGLVYWDDAGHHLHALRRGAVSIDTGPAGCLGAAVFTWRGDHRATGWLDAYRNHDVPVDVESSHDVHRTP